MSSKIGWLQRPGFKAESWNPIRARHNGKKGWHCVKCAAGCKNCWAAQQNKLMLRGGTGCTYTADSPAEVYLDQKTLEAPLHWRDPRMVFVCSMSDLFGEWVLNEWIAQIMDIILHSPKHTFLILTKRLLRAWDWSMHDNVWAGCSIATQEDARRNLSLFVEVRAPLRWVSYEPALGPVDFMPWLTEGRYFDWLVIGGESGPRHRTMNIDHVASAVRQCREASIPVFVKQDSGPRPGQQGRIPDELWIQEWPSR